MNVCYSAKKKLPSTSLFSRCLFLGDFRPGCILYLLIVFFFVSVTYIHADSSASTEDQPGTEVTFGGQTLKGRILRLLPVGIEFDPLHAKGKLTIYYEKIEKIVTQAIFLVYYGVEDTMVRGRLLGVEDSRLLIGANRI